MTLLTAQEREIARLKAAVAVFEKASRTEGGGVIPESRIALKASLGALEEKSSQQDATIKTLRGGSRRPPGTTHAADRRARRRSRASRCRHAARSKWSGHGPSRRQHGHRPRRISPIRPLRATPRHPAPDARRARRPVPARHTRGRRRSRPLGISQTARRQSRRRRSRRRRPRWFLVGAADEPQRRRTSRPPSAARRGSSHACSTASLISRKRRHRRRRFRPPD